MDNNIIFSRCKDGYSRALKDIIAVSVERDIYDFAFEIGIDSCDIDGDLHCAEIRLTRDEALELCNSILKCIDVLDDVYKEVE